MNNKLKFAIIAFITLGVIGGGVGIYFAVKPGDDNICEQINSKYNLQGDDKYKYQSDGINPNIPPVCCPSSCPYDNCGFADEPDNCNWKQKQDSYNNFILTFPPDNCKDILNSNDVSKTKKVCYIKS